jgi:RHS repeat-associated protein
VIPSTWPGQATIRFAGFVRLFISISLFSTLTFRVIPAFAQDPPDVAQGMSPSSTYHGSDIDFVDLVTGRLNLHIPLVVDHSQRGKLNFTYSLYFSGQTWYIRTLYCNPNCRYQWSLVKNTQMGVKFGIDGHLDLSTQWCTIKTCGYVGSVDSAVTDDGGVYHLGTITTSPLVERSVDGSGIQRTNNSSGFPNLTNKEGIQFGLTSVNITTGAWTKLAEDANGNEITTSGNSSVPLPQITTATDTLGRTWTLTTGSSNVTGCPVPAASANTWDIPGPANINNGVREFKFCYSNIPIQTHFGQGAGEYNSTWLLMTGVVLPDGTTWRFDYNSYGDIAVVYLPTGGTITYQWQVADPCGSTDGLEVVTQRTVFDGTNSNSWLYNPVVGSYTGGVRVTDPLGNDTVYNPAPVAEPYGSGGCARGTGKIQHYTGSYTNGTLLKTATKAYQTLPDPYLGDLGQGGAEPILLTSLTTAWGSNPTSGQTSQVQQSYDSGFTFTDTNPRHGNYQSVYGLVASESHSDYGSGAPGSVLSTTSTNYLPLSNSSYVTANILDLPSSIITADVAGNKCAETDYTYDDPGRLFTYTGTMTQHLAAPSSVRGNLTSTTRKLSGTPCQANASWTSLPPSYLNVYDTGMLYQSIDPLNHTTTYSYLPVSPCTVSTYYGAFVTQTTYPSTSSPNPASHVISGCYDFNTGSLTSFTDQNSQTTNYTYDLMLRPTNVTYPSPDGGQTNFYYPNTTTVEMKKQIDATRWTDSFTYYDGLGRESRSMSVNDEASPYDQVDTCYDADGRVGLKSYPYQGSGLSTTKVCSGAGDAFTYDPLNRVTQVTHSDNSTVLTSYTGRATSVQDEGNGAQRVQRISQVDGLGRLTSICEVASATQLGTGGTPAACGQDIGGTGFLTTYGYDALSNLTSVSQGGYLPRAFAYDSLSRLLTAANPESGTITYGYDNASRLTTRTAPKPSQSSSVTVTTTMAYDEINRLRTKTYANSDNSTTYLAPSVTFNYDETSALGVSGLNYTTGRESSAVVAGSQAGEVFSYDKLGRVRINSQCTPQNCGASTVFPITYNLDLLGDMTSGTNGMGVTLSYTVNRALRLTGMTSSLSDSNHPGTLYSSPHYNGAGSLLAATIGNPGSSVSETRTYDGRLRLASITDGSLYTLTIPANGYAPNSDILQANDSVNLTWSYSYDSFNRLCNANQSGTHPVCGQSALYTYDYDRFGNRWHQNGPHSMQYSSSGNNNRMDTYSYDVAGNLLSDGTTTYTYDSESRIISATNSISGTSTYQYDADGRRIRKTTNAGGTVDFLYDLSGHEISQVTSAGVWNRGEIYVGGRHLGTYSGGTGGTTTLTFSDWLGTERARSSPGATIACETITSLPFGDALTTTGSCGDPSPMHFTGKERDSESGLDDFEARYYSSQYGRFMIPDWAAKATAVPYAEFGDPQSLNLYSYVRNNPPNRADADGHEQLCYCELDTNKNSPMSGFSKRETQVETGVLELASAFFTGGATLEAAAAGPVTTAIGAISASGLAVSGTTRIVATAAGGKPEKVDEAASAVTTVTNPAGMAVTVASGGNLKAGAIASDIASVGSLAAHGSDAVKDPAGTALTLGNVANDIKSGVSALRSIFSQPPPPPPPPPPHDRSDR